MSSLHEAGQQIARAGFRTLNTIVRPVVKSGLGNPLPIGVGASIVETTGRVSGRPRPVPLLTLRIADTLVVSTVRQDSQWFNNMEKEPSVTVWLGGRPRAAETSLRRGPLNVAVMTLQPAD